MWRTVADSDGITPLDNYNGFARGYGLEWPLDSTTLPQRRHWFNLSPSKLDASPSFKQLPTLPGTSEVVPSRPQGKYEVAPGAIDLSGTEIALNAPEHSYALPGALVRSPIKRMTSSPSKLQIGVASLFAWGAPRPSCHWGLPARMCVLGPTVRSRRLVHALARSRAVFRTLGHTCGALGAPEAITRDLSAKFIVGFIGLCCSLLT